MDGWVPVYREILDGPVFKDPLMLQVFLDCLLRASHARQTVRVRVGEGFSTVTLDPGQFLFGRLTAAERLGMAPSTLYRHMKKLEELGRVTLKPDTHYSIGSIVNWAGLYAFPPIGEQAPDRHRAPTGQAPDRHRTPTGHIQQRRQGRQCQQGQEGRQEDETSRDDHVAMSLKEEDRENVLDFCRRKFQPDRYPVFPGRLKPEDRELLLKLGYLCVVAGTLPESWIDSALEAIRRRKRPPRNRAAYYTEVLGEVARKHEKNLNKMLATVQIPADLLTPPRERRLAE
jgi:hypothetical protein